jgi:hypothetical protein
LLEYKLWPQQLPIYNGIRSLPKKTETIVILCARQFGKSHLGVLMAIEDCLRYPGKCVLIMGPTLKQAREIVTPRMNDIRRDAPRGLIRPSKSEGKWYIGDSELVIGGFDVNSTSQRGKSVQTIYVEEIVDSNPDDYTESMRSDLGPALTHSDGGKMIFLTTPPKIPDHPFITDTMAQAELNDSLYIFTIDDNHQLTDDQREACVRRCGGKHTVDYRREYMCEIVRDASIVVVPDYDDTRHVTHVAFPMEFFPHTTIDFGGVRDKTAALLHWYNFFDDVTEVWDERVFEPNTPTGTIVKEILEMEKSLPPGVQVRRYADMPGQLQIDLNHHHKFECSVVGKDDWQSSINNLAVKFSVNKIRIHKRCAFLRQSLKSGTFNKQRNDFARSQALGHCDAIAALMYGVRMETKQNPYGQNHLSRDTHFYIPKPTPETEVATAIQPKQFANSFEGVFVPKKFGTFRR